MMSSDQYPGGSGGVDLPPPPPPTAGGLLGGLGAHQPASHQLSPYLNVNQNYLQTQVPEFLVNQEQRKGRIERSFTGIGGSVIVGSAVGGAYGLFDGVRQTALAGMKGKLRRTQIMNYTMKSGMSYKLQLLLRNNGRICSLGLGQCRRLSAIPPRPQTPPLGA